MSKIKANCSLSHFIEQFDVYDTNGKFKEQLTGNYEDFTSFVREYGYNNRWSEKFVHRKTGNHVEFIEQSGGGEGGAEDCETVLKIGEQYFSIQYKYYSYDGFDFDYAEVYEVKPVQVMVTQYHNV